ncbi:hypothetical protein DAPPUDRAFT_316116 [Daphnia pulex]|uniref:Uncharacterized protein n=1 Tax=Daphnia pulex TaxID=6669 RepID=E9GBR6_DAPPU|nr:hypothetical protein DAPPUDRAFT_316116 [Daphnia pulex]|eukprot:EFX83110.1 hypothetical protein DAPPUDRAFT_316116 [Daphnia pulex]
MPFSLHTASHCLEYVIQCLIEKGRLKEEMLELLINPHLKVLDLSKEASFESEVERNLRIVRLASVRCSQLTTLRIGVDCYDVKALKVESQRKAPISNCVKLLEDDIFFTMLQLFEHLQVLDLSYTTYGASCMQSLGATRKPILRELLVKWCPNVTDTVMLEFCIGQSSLYKLSIERTAVTSVGIKFAIEHLTELKEIAFDEEHNILKIFRDVHNESRELKKYSLTKLSIPVNVPYEKGGISLMVSMCPALVHLVMWAIEGITDVELLGFRELKQITSLIFLHDIDLTFPFHGGVVPILRVHGYSLECLYLPPITGGNVHLIIECCPNIRRLYLSIEDRPSDIAEQEEDLRSHEAAPLRMLETLVLLGSTYDSPFVISPEILVFLLSSPALIEIIFRNCPALTDQIIEKACARNTFKYLTKLKFFHCRNVNQKGIDFFMNEMNPYVKNYFGKMW